MNLKLNTVFQKNNLGVGKRKEAVARVFLISGTGNIVINKIPGEKYLQYNTVYLNNIWAPLKKIKIRKTIRYRRYC